MDREKRRISLLLGICCFILPIDRRQFVEILIILLMIIIGYGVFRQYQISKVNMQKKEEKSKQQITITLEFLSMIEELKKEYFTDVSRVEILRKYAELHESCIKETKDEICSTSEKE